MEQWRKMLLLPASKRHLPIAPECHELRLILGINRSSRPGRSCFLAVYLQTDDEAGISMGSWGTNVFTEACGHVNPLKTSRTSWEY